MLKKIKNILLYRNLEGKGAYLKAVSFLGAAIPQVKGLEEIKFMETDKNYDVFAKFINANLNTTLIYKFEKGNNDTDKNETNQITEDL